MIVDAAVLPAVTRMPYVPPVGSVVPLLGVTVVVIVIGALAPLTMAAGDLAISKPDLPLGTCTVTAPVLDVMVTFAGIAIGNVSPAPTVTPVPPTTTICVATPVVPIN